MHTSTVKLPKSVRVGLGEVPVALLRTHPKVLFWPVIRWLVFIAMAAACYIFVPRDLVDGWVYWVAQAVTFYLTLHYAVAPILKWWCRIFVVTDRQIMVQEGVLYKRAISSQLARVQDIRTERGILDRIFRCGTLIIVNAANGVTSMDDRVVFADVPHALKVEQSLKELVFAVQSRNMAAAGPATA
ncbi:PH domain-containing protein [Arthrobacter sp. A2-55]|uniref:PH domain-containing protein n=1 Tax=Arthrobacter sp. A2-55 TaxID=2897337 RepID=UPI0021CDDD02|nr:PH domain-containing protein [Arthrobacter sp. A2-55]MCU6480548.1 PH domain-containing protein [Arthrobacter sp. A2-55]